MQFVKSAFQTGDASPSQHRLALGAGVLGTLLLAAALIFWVASQWGHLAPDARLWLLRSVLAGSVLLAAVLAWRGARRWARLAAALAMACTGGLLALVGQIYQTGADAWPLFLMWAVLTLPWIILLRFALPWLLCAALLQLALWLYLQTNSIFWTEVFEPRVFLSLAVLDMGLLALAEWSRSWLDDPWHLARRFAVVALLSVLGAANLQAALVHEVSEWFGVGMVLVPSALILAGLYWGYARSGRDLAVGALSMLAGLGLLWVWVWPHIDGLLALLVCILLLLGLGLAALGHLHRLWRISHQARRATTGAVASDHAQDAVGEVPRDQDPWFLALLRVGVLGAVVLLLVAWVVLLLEIDDGMQALALGVILLVAGLWLARRRAGASGRQLGEVLAGVGLILATGGIVFLDVSQTAPFLPLLLMLALGLMVFLASTLQALRLLAALAVLGMALWLFWPPGQRGPLDPISPEDWPPGLMLRLWWCQAGAVLAWVLSLRAHRRALWRPIAWALLLLTPPLAWLATLFGAGLAWELPRADVLAGLTGTLLPGLVLGAWLDSRRALPRFQCWLAALALCLAGLGWLGAPGVSVALTWVLLAGLAGHRPLLALGVALVLASLFVFYLDPVVLLVDKAWRLGLAGSWLLAIAGVAAWPARRQMRNARLQSALWLPAGMLATGALILGMAQIQVHQYRMILTEGRAIVLQLAPVDPRSLMQGDYMALDYAVRRPLSGWLADHPAVMEQLEADGRGWLVLQADAQGIWQLSGITTTAPGAGAATQTDARVALAFHWRAGQADWGGRSWFFPEGGAARYAQARYGVLRVAADGTALLAGLLDEAQQPL